jgi:LuxR family transcriptional activator of bioluminescence operon
VALNIIPKKWFSTIREEISQISSKNELIQKLEQIKQDIGADYYSCGTYYENINQNKDVVFITSDTPVAWQEEYKDQGYIYNDPLVIKARKTNIPFLWEDVENETYGNFNILEKATQYQLNYGIVFPIHGANGLFGFLFLIYKEKPGKMKSRFEHIMPYMQIIAAQLIEVQIKLIKFETGNSKLNTINSNLLTKRQRECLLWAAEGKTTEEISIILLLSISTVTHHLELAREKLNSDNRTQCIAKALDQNLIALEHKKKPTISYLRI